MSIKDVAKLAGVAPSTVSRIVNSGDTSAASLDTRQKIWDAVRTVGYVPNQNARNLKHPQETVRPVCRDIDCVYARIAGPHIDPFFTTLMHAAEVEIFARGYNLRYQYSILDVESGKIQRPNASADAAIILGRVDGATVNLLQGQYKHLVCASLQTAEFQVDQVISSGYQAAADCVHYLYTQGHRRICYLGETENEQRYQGYLNAMLSIGERDTASLTVEASFSPAGGYDAVNELLDRGKQFTAIFCANDMLAVGAMKALKEHRLRIPRDVSLIGINDMETVRYLDPMLSTVHIPLDEMGKHTAKLLIDRIEGGHRLPVTLIVPNNLICRESSGPARSDETRRG